MSGRMQFTLSLLSLMGVVLFASCGGSTLRSRTRHAPADPWSVGIAMLARTLKHMANPGLPEDAQPPANNPPAVYASTRSKMKLVMIGE